MKEIADNNFYTIKADQGKNRVYLTIKGFWQDVDQVREYPNDLEKATNTISKGFTIVSDLRTMKTPSQEVGVMHVRAQQRLVKSGLSKTAEVHPESTVTKLSLNRFSNESGMEKGMFQSVEEAEEWLDS